MKILKHAHLYTVLFKEEVPSMYLVCQAFMSLENYIPYWQSTFFSLLRRLTNRMNEKAQFKVLFMLLINC